ncbi:nicotinamide N-methyltransferase-like isoform X2 [Electrophorus electricus]|nr:nicotinamide N-methyltransferase-like isoform X2 [Electrophorus electricus]
MSSHLNKIGFFSSLFARERERERAQLYTPVNGDCLSLLENTLNIMEEVAHFTEGEFYQVHFDSRAYIDSFYSCPRGHEEEENFLSFVLACLSRTFSTGKYKGQRLIEVGSGPTIHSIISACEYFQEIVLSDFADNNRKEIVKWLKNEEGCFDWNPIIQHVCAIEGKRPFDVEVNLRQRVKQVLKCDVRLENPFHPHNIDPAECVITSLCLEAACKDLETYRKALRGVATLVRPGGILVMVGVLGQTFYYVNEKRFSCLILSKTNIESILENLGFTIHEFNILPAQDRKKIVSDFQAVFHLVALKSATYTCDG